MCMQWQLVHDNKLMFWVSKTDGEIVNCKVYVGDAERAKQLYFNATNVTTYVMLAPESLRNEDTNCQLQSKSVLLSP